jgi:hypothetical protein
MAYRIYQEMKDVGEWYYVWDLESVLVKLELLTKTGWLGHGNT